jgi:hypothetical protein
VAAAIEGGAAIAVIADLALSLLCAASSCNATSLGLAACGVDMRGTASVDSGAATICLAEGAGKAVLVVRGDTESFAERAFSVCGAREGASSVLGLSSEAVSVAGVAALIDATGETSPTFGVVGGLALVSVGGAFTLVSAGVR